MRSKSTLKVDTELPYDLNVSPRSSLESHEITKTTLTTTQPNATCNPTPSIRLLFSLIPRHHCLVLLIPAILSSVIAGGIAPFMTIVVGQAFNAFAQFPSSSPPAAAAKATLLHQVGISCLELIALGVGSIALGSLTSCLWIWVGEINAMSVRNAVYQAVVGKDMVWFDSNLGDQMVDENAQGPVGAGGLMAKFARETDDVRMASSLASGMLIQYLTTAFTCLILAFMRSWSLTLIILSAVPALMIVQAFSQAFANPLLSVEREQTAISATIIERAISAISTVKAFNATSYENSRATQSFLNLQQAARKLNLLWGFTSGMAQFVMMAMFVQGFWFGAKLVREHKVGAGDVMSVFWACLIATSNLQMCIPQFIVLAKGKFSIAALLGVVGDSQPSSPTAHSPSTFTSSTPRSSIFSFRRRSSHHLRKITPSKCFGELALHNISFAYPSRPTLPVLKDVSLFLPANEMTFIVGSSGSGKSTIAQLLLRMYEPQEGAVTLDERDVRFLDEEWMRGHVAGVGQQGASGVVILDGKTLFENVAIGACLMDGEVCKADVEEACRSALMHEFVRDLPLGYETILGGGAGVGLSGGQKQRLSIARAKLRNPTVLILDEATSALDGTSRILVFEAIKRWRHNKTTIVITHDLSQIESGDFVYVLKDGRVVEQGFRYDLESVFEEDEGDGRGEFRKMMERQSETGGFLPEKDVAPAVVGVDSVEEVLKQQEEEEERSKEKYNLPAHLKHQSIAIRPLSLGNWMFDVVADLTSPKPAVPPLPPALTTPKDTKKERRLTIHIPSPTVDRHPQLNLTLPTSLPPIHTNRRRLSLQFTPTSPVFSVDRQSTLVAAEDDEEDGWKEKEAVQRSGVTARVGREKTRAARNKIGSSSRSQDVPLSTIKVEAPSSETSETEPTTSTTAHPQFWSLMRRIYPTIPHKPILFLGLLICLFSGSMTPIFSFLLSRLLFEVSSGAQDISVINRFGGLVLGIAALDGLFLGLKYYIMEYCGMSWTTHLRSVAIQKVLKQDKKWFDARTNSASDIVQVVVKDGDDARNLVSVVWCQFLVVGAMLGVGLVWALIRGWQLTLAGFAIAPVFAGVMAVQTRLVVQCEARNKRAREDVARGYYNAIINIRGIRCMAFEGVFKAQFDGSVNKALNTGVRGAFVEGCTYGVASGLIYLAEALLFYVGAVLIARGLYTYLQMVEVLNLVVFSVTIGSQLMAFTEKIAKSVQATHDLYELTTLSLLTDESKGSSYPSLSGSISFNNVRFNYPSRLLPTPILKSISLDITPGECVALVGSSGSGKSTIAALLQRLYEPEKGEIKIGGKDVRDVDVNWLREHVGVVSQQPNLFDASIADNIRYGSSPSSSSSAAVSSTSSPINAISDVAIRQAAKSANVHSFIMSLPQGYDTPVGENASLISGGQAQRLQIARALVRPWTKILILDECTSSLDAENQAVVLETIRELMTCDGGGAGKGEGRTTLMITHKLQVMQMCDRILVVDKGEIVENGTFEQLMEKKGVFAGLANGGEWVWE
ncbi:P-loop containing nucleoside triphosphate hydrolase protein [Phlegmacium glaucopus]|nr:P-loop containing nucleoside triphosphate hydrolase protein [Phlegmacium glaucopus]